MLHLYELYNASQENYFYVPIERKDDWVKYIAFEGNYVKVFGDKFNNVDEDWNDSELRYDSKSRIYVLSRLFDKGIRW